MTLSSHPLSSDLDRLAQGRSSRANAANLVFHLQACEECRCSFERKYRWESADLWSRLLGDLKDLEPPKSKRGLRHDFETEVRTAKAALDKLRIVSPEKRHLIVRNTRAFATLAGVQALLEEARGHWHASPMWASHWAELALQAVEVVPTGKYPLPLFAVYMARAWSYSGNAKRLASNLAGAESDLEKAGFWLEHGVPDPVETAMFLRVEGTLARDQRKFDLAERKLRGALRLCCSKKNTVLSAWLENMLGIIYLDSGAFLAARRQYETLFNRFGNSMSLELRCASHQNLSLALAGGGFTDLATHHLQQARSHAGPTDSQLLRARFDWLEARIHMGARNLSLAARLLGKVQRSFLEKAALLDVAIVGLDLTSVLGAQGNIAEARRQAEKSKSIFLERKLHGQVQRASKLLREALS